MEALLTILVAVAVGSTSFFLGSVLSPTSRMFKQNATSWQGLYGQLKKQLDQVTREAEEADPLIALAERFGIDGKTAKSLLGNPMIRGIIEKKVAEFTGQSGKTTKSEGGEVWG